MKTSKIFQGGISIAAILAVCVGIVALFSSSAVSAQQVYPVPTCSIYATSSSGSGSAVTLSWNSTNGTYAFLNPGGSVATNGSQVVYPTVTTTYTLTVNSAQGLTANCQTTVYVSGSSGSLSCTIYANPSTVNYSGNGSTLTWNSSNATSANLTNTGSVSTSGSQMVYPSGTTTYILTVYNAQGQSANCQTTVTVGTSGIAPSCWITLSPYSYSYQQQATLSWGSTNATSAYISPNVGSVSTSGSQMVYPSGNQIYTMTVYNSQGQSATCQTSYIPSGVLSCTITANPMSIQNGSSSYLSWTSTGATSAYLSDGIGNVAPNGSLTVRPESSRNYTLTVSGIGATQTCNTYLSVSGSYISLTQIPYTGFDLGPIGNALYWAALTLFALGAGYLVVYYMPFARLRIARSGRQASTARIISDSADSEVVETPAIFVNREVAPVSSHAQSIASEIALQELPVFPDRAGSTNDSTLKDSMKFAESKNGAPRIIIDRN